MDDFSVNYYQGALFYQFKATHLQIAFESLSSDRGQYSFQAPLATKHANFESKHQNLSDTQKFWFWYQLAF